eukprot:gene26946-33133_t
MTYEYALSRQERDAVVATEAVAAHPECEITREYRSSALELRWLSRIATPAYDWSSVAESNATFAPSIWKGCTALLQDHSSVARWLSDTKEPESAAFASDVFSLHTHRNSCDHTAVDVPIEPLAALLRNPHALCIANNRNRTFDTTHVLHGSALASQRARPNAERHLYLLYDRSLFDDGALTDTDMLDARLPEVVRIWWWGTSGRFEKWARQPFGTLPNVTRYPMGPVFLEGVTSDDDPIGILKRNTRLHDFATLHVRLEDGARERALLHALENDPEAMALLDDVYYSAAKIGRDGGLVFKENRPLHEAYELFLRFRKAGVRMHGWV